MNYSFILKSDSCHDQGCKNEMIWASHKEGWGSCT